MKKRESPDFRSPEVGISVVMSKSPVLFSHLIHRLASLRNRWVLALFYVSLLYYFYCIVVSLLLFSPSIDITALLIGYLVGFRTCAGRTHISVTTVTTVHIKDF